MTSRTQTKYPSSQRLAVVVRPDQKEWLKTQAGAYESMSDVLRRLIDQAMQEELTK